VTFTSAADVGSQRAWLSRASVLVAANLHTGAGVSIMQAVAAGVPVAASTWAAPPGLEAVIRTFPPNRAELREALRSILKLSDEERANMAREARATALTVLDWSVVAQRYLQLYDELA